MTWGLQQRDYPILTAGQMSPFHQALQSGLDTFQNEVKSAYLPANMQQDLLRQQLANQISGVQAKYAEPMTQADLLKSQLFNQYYGKDIESQIAERQAQAGLAGSEAAKNRFLMSHPGYIVGGTAGNLEYLNGLGYNINQSTGAAPPSPPQQTQSPLQMTPINGAPVGGGVPQIPSAQRQPLPGQGPSGSQMQMGGALPMGQNTQAFSTNPMVNAMLNQMVYGSPMNPIQQAQFAAYKANLASKQGYGVKEAEAAETGAANANEIDKQLNKLEDSYNKSSYKGQAAIGGGEAKTTGLLAGVRSLYHDWTPEQNSDTASQNIVQNLLPLMKGKVTNYELNYLQGLKPSRLLNPEAFHSQVAMLRAANDRANEYARFYNAGLNQGYDPITLKGLWNQYAQQRPVIDVGGKSVNKENLNSSIDYLKPEAAMALQAGQNWEPPIRDADIEHTAKTHGMTVKAVREQLKKEGRL